MLLPKRVKHRKVQKGRMTGLAYRGAKVSFGEYALQATGCGRMTARQIEAARIAMTRYTKRQGKVWIRVFPDKPISKKPALYLGRRRDFPSQYIVDWKEHASEKMLDFLWSHATQSRFKYTHIWELGDMILWDNRCTMHYRDPINSDQLRVMHRTQMQREKPICA